MASWIRQISIFLTRADLGRIVRLREGFRNFAPEDGCDRISAHPTRMREQTYRAFVENRSHCSRIDRASCAQHPAGNPSCGVCHLYRTDPIFEPRQYCRTRFLVLDFRQSSNSYSEEADLRGKTPAVFLHQRAHYIQAERGSHPTRDKSILSNIWHSSLCRVGTVRCSKKSGHSF